MIMNSWLSIPKESDFSISNLPFGVFSFESQEARCATILGDTVIDLSILEEAGLFLDIENLNSNVFSSAKLNAFMKHPRPVWKAVRDKLIQLFMESPEDPTIKENPNLQDRAFYKIHDVDMHLPIQIGDYTDFYSSREHATNVGTMFRGKDNALQPNWLHLPVGYHGRASTIYVSGTDIRRPCGQLQKVDEDPKAGSVYGASRSLDFELEIAAVVGGSSNGAGIPLSLNEAKERIFGFLIMNDWSARDIQKWEYVPLGPFTSKNFATTVSPWIVTALALGPFVAPTSAVVQESPKPLSYLDDPTYSSYDIHLSVEIQTSTQATPTTVCNSNFRNLYWNSAQQLVHHSVTGCVMEAGDLLGSGTLSGQDPGSFGSMLELSWRGTKSVPIGDENRTFLEDGDMIVMKGYCANESRGRVGFGCCAGVVKPAVSDLPPTPVPPTVDTFHSFRLYSYWESSSSWRVRAALAMKGIRYSTVGIDLKNNKHRTDDYLAICPLGQVPMLECTDGSSGKRVRLSQSVAIIDFLDTALPSKRRMFPINPVERAEAMEMIELINSGTQPLQNQFFLKKIELATDGKVKAKDLAKETIEKGLRAFEQLVISKQATKKGSYSMGTFFPTVVDVFLVPQLYNGRRFGVDLEKLVPLLVQVEKKCYENFDYFEASHPNSQLDKPSKI